MREWKSNWLERRPNRTRVCRIELQRHVGELSERPSEWMLWNYRDTLEGFLTGQTMMTSGIAETIVFGQAGVWFENGRKTDV